ncbi:MAG: biotin/lipoate A/B protein ligase family protein [Limisphaerales bacterium]
MDTLDLTFPTPAENLACDEVLLDWREEGGGGEVLRFWESPEPFVVVGYANKVATEVDVAACERAGIPIFRRCSGGGTVLQGRGCLNYALILRITEGSPTAGISTANRFIMERNCEAIRKTSGGGLVSVRGHTDLVIDDVKFSGNSQRRRKNFLLFHGTFLLDFKLELIGEFLRMPSQQPDYRNGRSHSDFVTNLGIGADEVKRGLARVWQADSVLENPPMERVAALAREKYATREWNWKF